MQWALKNSVWKKFQSTKAIGRSVCCCDYGLEKDGYEGMTVTCVCVSLMLDVLSGDGWTEYREGAAGMIRVNSAESIHRADSTYISPAYLLCLSLFLVYKH